MLDKNHENPHGWLFRNQEYPKRTYSHDDLGTKTEGRRIDAKAMATQTKTCAPKGTRNGTKLDKDEVLSFVSHNANLDDHSETYEILMQGSDDNWFSYINGMVAGRPTPRWLQSIPFH